MSVKIAESDKETLKRALADPKSEEMRKVAAAMVARHKAAIAEMLRNEEAVQ